jgi:hypothetical protein
MVLQKTVENLKARPRSERRAIARVTALAVVALLFIGWVILFFNNIRENGIQIQPIDIPVQEALNTPQAVEARMQIRNSIGEVQDTLRAAQQNSGAQADTGQTESPAPSTY